MLKRVTINKMAKKHLINKPTSFVYIITVAFSRFVMINKISSQKILNMKYEVVKPTARDIR